MRTIISSPALLFPFVDLFSALCGNGMLESMLEPHLRETGASTIDIGVSFLVFGCCYSIGNMLFGSVGHRVKSHIGRQSFPLRPTGNRQMGLSVVFLLGGQSDVPDHLYFRRPRQFHPDHAGRASHSGD